MYRFSADICWQILTLRSLPLEITPVVGGSLGVALFMTLANQFYIEPYSTKIMLERYDLENTEGGEVVVTLPDKTVEVHLTAGMILGGTWAQYPHCNKPTNPGT